jgi:HTH-like domain
MGIQMKYQFIEQHKQEFPVVVMCQVLGVSESGFYAWHKRPTCRRQREDAQLSTSIRQVFTTHQGRYGSPRLHAELHEQGQRISRKRVARLMREAGLCAKRKRHGVATTREILPIRWLQISLQEILRQQNRTKMGGRYHVYSYSTGVALSCGDPGHVFAAGRGMVDVGLL